jgi:hypothetical protein
MSPYPNSIGAAALMACDEQHLNCRLAMLDRLAERTNG